MSLKAPLVIVGGGAIILGYGLVYNGMMWLALIHAAEEQGAQQQGLVGRLSGGFVHGFLGSLPGVGVFFQAQQATSQAAAQPAVTSGVGPTWFPPIGFIDSFIPGRLPLGSVTINIVSTGSITGPGVRPMGPHGGVAGGTKGGHNTKGGKSGSGAGGKGHH